MKLLPHQRRQSKEVKRTSSVLDDYANLLSRDSGFLTTAGEEASVATTLSESISVHGASTASNGSVSRPSVVAVPSVASFERQEVALGALLGKGHFTKVYEITSIELFSSDHDDSHHENRAIMSENARAGLYAMKRLRKKLLRRSRGEFTRAAAALLVEAQFLTRLDHPNILKLRGSALGGASSFSTGDHDAYFLILDRVSETLAERIHATWAVQRTAGSNSKKINEAALLYEKTQCALQLASALRYLHDRRIIFRDVKPANLGFSAKVSADQEQTQSLQLYDFGMARELPVALGLANELFHMTQSAGTKPYTAVEVGTTGLYNLKADVYSFAMVVYEMMAEQMPFAHYMDGSKKEHNALISNREFVQAVYIDGERPVFDTAAAPAPPQDIQDLLTDCWDADLFQRPTMDQVFARLQDASHLLPGPHNEDLTAIPPKPQVPLVVMEAQQQQPSSSQQAAVQRKLGGSITEMSDISSRE